ncbi:MAG: hypothetical protein JWN04_250 [Myxococcaceae bacterium]|nr:hypothetical protein [Myxococcaceae bacterium]
MSSPSGAPHPNQDPSYELGDLELAPRSARGSLQTPRKPGGAPVVRTEHEPDLDDELTRVADHKPGRSDNDHSLGEFSRGNDISELDESVGYDHFGDDDRSLELDVPPEQIAIGAPSKPPLRASLGNGMSLPPRSSRAPRSGSPRDEERAARELADYGEPEAGFGAPGYVVRVAQRWVGLYRARRQIERRASELADHYEKALRDLGRALLDDSAVTQHDSLRERVLLVQTKQGELARAEEATREARAREESELSALRQKSAALEAELAPFLQAERAAETNLAKLDAELKRCKAKVQRAEIELRAMTRASLPPPAERVQNVEIERSTQQTEIDTLTTAQSEATAALGRARRELALRRGSVDGAGRAQEQQQQAARAKSRAHEEAIARAEHALSAALCTLAEAAEALGLAHSANEQVEGLRAREKALDLVVDELAKYDRALTLYDRAALLKGSIMWLALFAVIAILIRIL